MIWVLLIATGCAIGVYRVVTSLYTELTGEE